MEIFWSVFVGLMILYVTYSIGFHMGGVKKQVQMLMMIEAGGKSQEFKEMLKDIENVLERKFKG